jgi:hypothetical protein
MKIPVFPAWIRPESVPERSRRVPSTTRQALSTGEIRSPIAQNDSPKIPKYDYFPIKLAVIPARIHSESVPERSKGVPSTTRRALSTGKIRFPITQNISRKMPKNVFLSYGCRKYSINSYEFRRIIAVRRKMKLMCYRSDMLFSICLSSIL